VTAIRVLMLTDRFPPDYGGGARQALNLCEKLVQRGVQTSVISAYRGAKTITDRIGSLEVTRVPQPEQKGFSIPLFYVRLMTQLLRRRGEYDLIHAHALHHHAYVGFLAGGLLRKPAIGKVAGLGTDDPASISHRRLGGVQLTLLHQATLLVATNQAMVGEVVGSGWPPERLVCIPNGVDTERFRPAAGEARASLRARLELPRHAPIMVFTGPVIRGKGIHDLARAWRGVKEKLAQARLLIVGPCTSDEHGQVDERYVSEVRSILQEGGVAESVRFVGLVEEPAPYLQASDVFVLPTQREGMPNSLLEAMATGLPLVATRIDCIEEMVPPELRDHLVEVGDADALARALVALGRDLEAGKELGALGRQRVVRLYSLDAVADLYVELYRQLLAE
jgi:glycosyltransferase involved in cell wall biosynthesis